MDKKFADSLKEKMDKLREDTYKALRPIIETSENEDENKADDNKTVDKKGKEKQLKEQIEARFKKFTSTNVDDILSNIRGNKEPTRDFALLYCFYHYHLTSKERKCFIDHICAGTLDALHDIKWKFSEKKLGEEGRAFIDIIDFGDRLKDLEIFFQLRYMLARDSINEAVRVRTLMELGNFHIATCNTHDNPLTVYFADENKSEAFVETLLEQWKEAITNLNVAISIFKAYIILIFNKLDNLKLPYCFIPQTLFDCMSDIAGEYAYERLNVPKEWLLKELKEKQKAGEKVTDQELNSAIPSFMDVTVSEELYKAIKNSFSHYGRQ